MLGCSEPAVAVTVTTDATGAGCVAAAPPPPQPLIRLRATRSIGIDRSIRSRLRRLQPKMHTMIAKVLPENRLPYLHNSYAVVGEVVMVRVVVAVPPDGMTAAGEKLQDAPTGRPEQLNVTVDANPFNDVIETIVEALCPATSVMEGIELTTEKSGAGRLMIYAALPTVLLDVPPTIAMACTVSDDVTVMGPLYTEELVLGIVPSVV